MIASTVAATSLSILRLFARLSLTCALAFPEEAVSTHVTSFVANPASGTLVLAKLPLATLAQCIDLHGIWGLSHLSQSVNLVSSIAGCVSLKEMARVCRSATRMCHRRT